jgi:glutamyl-tRNA synthetase
MKARGRFAPSPTGLMHVGNARTALAAWLSIRSQGGAFVWRLEDLDQPRVVAEMAEAAQEDLSWLGLDWDEGPDVGGPFAPYEQSRRYGHYEEALRQLHAAGRLFPCRVSRKDLLEMASAPHGAEGLPPYPPDLRPHNLPADWFERLCMAEHPDASIRFQVHEEPVVFHDRVLGRIEEHTLQSAGDFVLKRRDGVYAYQLAVVVDDLLMGITEVVRGADLLDSTGRQIQLIEALGGPIPAYAHVPLVVNASGEKLSKRDEGLTLRSLRGQNISPEQLAGYLGYSLGLLDTPRAVPLQALIPRFEWEKIRTEPWSLPVHLADRLRGLF